MDVEIKSEKRNGFFLRREIIARIIEIEKPMARPAIREAIAKKLMLEVSQLVVVKAEHKFETKSIDVHARHYDSKEAMLKYEKNYILVRNGIVEKSAKKKESGKDAGKGAKK